jgi:hypothetical protein
MQTVVRAELGTELITGRLLWVSSKRRYRKSEVLVRQMSGNATLHKLVE